MRDRRAPRLAGLEVGSAERARAQFESDLARAGDEATLERLLAKYESYGPGFHDEVGCIATPRHRSATSRQFWCKNPKAHSCERFDAYVRETPMRTLLEQVAQLRREQTFVREVAALKKWLVESVAQRDVQAIEAAVGRHEASEPRVREAVAAEHVAAQEAVHGLLLAEHTELARLDAEVQRAGELGRVIDEIHDLRQVSLPRIHVR